MTIVYALSCNDCEILNINNLKKKIKKTPKMQESRPHIGLRAGVRWDGEREKEREKKNEQGWLKNEEQSTKGRNLEACTNQLQGEICDW